MNPRAQLFSVSLISQSLTMHKFLGGAAPIRQRVIPGEGGSCGSCVRQSQEQGTGGTRLLCPVKVTRWGRASPRDDNRQ